MKKILKIFIRDLKNIIHIKAAFIIIGGLCLIPSLYAWINIKACWNPYVNTENLPVAVVNQDEGASIKGKFVNVGNQIVDQLKKNHDIGWTFVDEWQGNYKLNEGKFYALIEIPSDFTKDLSTLTTNDPQKPNIIYKANEKANAIATKITDVAKDKLVQEIKSNFVDTVNEESLSVLKSLGEKLESNKPKIIELKDALSSTYANLEKIESYLNDTNKHTNKLKDYLNNTKENLPKITQQINSLQSVVNSSKNLISITQNSVNNLSQDLNNNMSSLNDLNTRIQDEINNLKILNNSLSNENMQKNIELLKKLISPTESVIDKTINNLKKLNNIKNTNNIKIMINSLQELKSILNLENNKLNSIETLIKNGNAKEKVNEQFNYLSDFSNSFNNKLNLINNTFTYDVTNVLNSVSNSLISNSDNINNILESINVIVPQLSSISTFGISTSDVVLTQAKHISTEINKFEKDLQDLIDKTKILTNENIEKIISILNKNSKDISSFISSPINVKTEELYNAQIFGVALMPFYTVLAIWVGALLSTSILTTECEELKGETTNLTQKHFGKMMTFMFISLIQSLIITTGDIFIFKVPQSIFLMYLFTVVSSIIFTTIIFTLVSLFGNVGKAIAIVIMVFQIAGSGGIYPIQTNPKIFEVLQPFWPFTYAIDGFREAIAGPSIESIKYDLIMLSIFFVIYLSLVILKKPFHKVTEFMYEKFKESGL